MSTDHAQSERILVTGGAGFIGNEVARQLTAAGHRVVVLDNLANGKLANLADVADDVEVVVGDIRDDSVTGELMARVDRVFHLACLGVRHSLHDPFDNHDVNATATLRLLQLAQRADVARFVTISSSEVYGTAQWAPMTEQHPTFPMTVYGAGKLAGECYTRAFHSSYDMATVVVRPFNSFGPRSHHEGDSGEVIPKFMLRSMVGQPMVIFGDGTQTRDFTFVTDTARGVILSGFSDEAIGETINLGQGREITVNELATTVAAVTGASDALVRHDPPRPGDVLRLCSDSTKAINLLGFQPATSLRDGLQHLLGWYLESGSTPEELLVDERVHNWIQPADHHG